MFECLVNHDTSESELDALGAKGWELVSVVFRNANGSHTLYFKREMTKSAILGIVPGKKYNTEDVKS